VGHSLGGLVIERAIQLSENNAEEHLRGIEKHTLGILFFGTPHRGSGIAPFAKSIGRLLQTALGKRVNTAILEALEQNSSILLDVEDWFGQWLRRRREGNLPVEITSFYEEMALPQIGHVVDETSVTVSGYSTYSIPANHMVSLNFECQDNI
jgi:hypothetical protein